MKRACTNYTNSYEQNNTGFLLLSPSGFIRPLKIKSVWLKKMALIVTALFTLNSYIEAHPFSGGDGSLANPYKISTVVQLDSVRNYLNANFILINDLDFAGSQYDSIHNPEGWVPIGTLFTHTGFTGSFNGAGHTISNLYINRPSISQGTGLFGYTNGAEIDSLGLLNCNISNNHDCTGCLVGYNIYTTLKDCYATGKIVSTTNCGNIGGLVGETSSSTLTDCHAAVYVNCTSSLSQQCGGLVGYNYQTPITNCYTTGNVSVGEFVGGLIGTNLGLAPITNCYATGNISGNYTVGGLVGKSSSTMTDCYATGKVTGINQKTGGLVGHSFDSITNCYATGQVSGASLTGGLVGDNSGVLINCHAIGQVSGSANIGGLAGLNNSNMTNCYASGNVTGTGSYIGGLAGASGGILTNCNATGQVSGNEYIGGLMGKNGGNLTNCNASGKVTGTGSYIGGITGYSSVGTLSNCIASSQVSGDMYVGGLVGFNISTVVYCYAIGSVSGTSKIGGLVGNNGAVLTNCYAAGQVSGDLYIGGLVGHNYCRSVANCYATGQVSGKRDVGGLTGLSSTLLNCYATGKVTGNEYTGGLVGEYTASTITNCFYNTETSGQSNGIGFNHGTATVTGLTTAEMKQQSSFTGFDFSTVWSITGGTTFPRLQSTYNVPVILNNLAELVKKDILYTDTIEVVPMDNNNITITLESCPAGMQLNDSIISWTPDSSGFYTIAIKASDSNAKYSAYNAKIAVWTGGGVGTNTNPYQITTIGDLNMMRQKSSGTYFVLMNDLDFTGSVYDSKNSAKGWEPIASFSGSFNGNGHTISNLYINRDSTDYIGLFGNACWAEFDSLGLLNCNIKGYHYIGGLAGYIDSSTVTNCYATGKVRGRSGFIGGLVGEYDYSILMNCYATCKVYGGELIGGLAGVAFNYSSTTNCYATGQVLASSGNAGGLIGYNTEYSPVTNCYASGKVTGNQDVGGLVGRNSQSPINNCYYNTETSGQSSAGGTGLTTAMMKKQSSFTGFDFNTVWAIRVDSTYPALRTLNNAPFAFSDTITGVGASVSYSRLLPNDYDYETLQTAMVVSIESLSSGSFRNNAVYLPDTATIGDKYIVYYRVGEVLANDTLWGNEARSVLIATTNTAPVLTAVRDTTTNEDESITLTMSSVTATDAQGDVLSIIVHSGTNYSVSGTTVIPAAGYYGNLSVPVSVTDGRDTSNILTMNITVIANPVYTITASAGTGGNIDPSGAVSVEEGYSQSFTITANNGYHIADVLVDGSSVGAVSNYTFNNVITGHSIAASFAVNTYTITASAGNNGSINPSGAVSVVEGNSQSFTITANNGYHIEDVLVDGSNVGAVSSYNFSNVTANHTITASFDTNTVGLPKEIANCISVSPNPFINTLTISTDYWGDGYYTLVSIIGNEIGSGPLTDKVTELNLSGLKSGVYLLQVKVKAKVHTIQIVKL